MSLTMLENHFKAYFFCCLPTFSSPLPPSIFCCFLCLFIWFEIQSIFILEKILLSLLYVARSALKRGGIHIVKCISSLQALPYKTLHVVPWSKWQGGWRKILTRSPSAEHFICSGFVLLGIYETYVCGVLFQRSYMWKLNPSIMTELCWNSEYYAHQVYICQINFHGSGNTGPIFCRLIKIHIQTTSIFLELLGVEHAEE